MPWAACMRLPLLHLDFTPASHFCSIALQIDATASVNMSVRCPPGILWLAVRQHRHHGWGCHGL